MKTTFTFQQERDRVIDRYIAIVLWFTLITMFSGQTYDDHWPL